MKYEILIDSIKKSIFEIEPEAEIILYGSRARGDSTSESDWDFLILLEGAVDDNRTDKIRRRLYEIEWETGEILTSIIRNRRQWNSLPYAATPFHKNVEMDRVVL